MKLPKNLETQELSYLTHYVVMDLDEQHLMSLEPVLLRVL